MQAFGIQQCHKMPRKYHFYLHKLAILDRCEKHIGFIYFYIMHNIQQHNRHMLFNVRLLTFIKDQQQTCIKRINLYHLL